MSILDRVAEELSWTGMSSKVISRYAITAFLKAAAEQGWHMRRDITGTGCTDEFEWDK